jgi:hypothetical protein
VSADAFAWDLYTKVAAWSSPPSITNNPTGSIISQGVAVIGLPIRNMGTLSVPTADLELAMSFAESAVGTLNGSGTLHLTGSGHVFSSNFYAPNITLNISGGHNL